jgi:uncharacterized protein DUF1565
MAHILRHIGRAMLPLLLLVLLPLAMAGTTPAAQASSLLSPSQIYYVDPVGGSDANKGNQNKPFRTLFKALTTAQSGDTINLGPGVYSQATNGEQFGTNTQPIPAVSGLTIVGALENGLPASTLQGTGNEVGLRLQANATVQNLHLTDFDIAISAVQGQHALSNLSLTQNSQGIFVGNSSQTTLTTSTISLSATATGVLVAGTGQFTMDGGSISGGAANCATGATGLFVFGSGQATLKNAINLTNIAGAGLAIQDTAKATLDTATISRTLPSSCIPLASVRAAGSASLTLHNSIVRSVDGTNAAGIEMQDSVQLALEGGSVSRHTGTAIHVLGTGKLSVNGSSFTSNQIGVDASGAPQASITITAATLQYNKQMGIIAPAFKLRNSSVHDNGVGIKINGLAADLGTLADAGSNTIQNNTTTGVTFASTISRGSVNAVGNTWNATVQGADANGHYTRHILVSGLSTLAHGTNFDMPNENTVIQL